MSRGGGTGDLGSAKFNIEGDASGLKSELNEVKKEAKETAEEVGNDFDSVGKKIDEKTQGVRKFSGALSGAVGVATGMIGVFTAVTGIVIGAVKAAEALAHALRDGKKDADDLLETLESSPAAAARNLEVLRARADEIRRTISDIETQELESAFGRAVDEFIPQLRDVADSVRLDRLREELAAIEPEIKAITRQVQAQRDAQDDRIEKLKEEADILGSLTTLEAERDAALASRETIEDKIQKITEETAELVEQIEAQGNENAQERIDRANEARDELIAFYQEQRAQEEQAEADRKDREEKAQREREDREAKARQEREKREAESAQRQAQALEDAYTRAIESILGNQSFIGTTGTGGGFSSDAVVSAINRQTILSSRPRPGRGSGGIPGGRR